MTLRAVVMAAQVKPPFFNGIQQDILCKWLTQIRDASSVQRLIARGLVVACGHKMTGHFDPDAASRRCSSIPEIPPR
jgi:hypothetical protein